MIEDQPLPMILLAQATCGTSKSAGVVRSVLVFRMMSGVFMIISILYL